MKMFIFLRGIAFKALLVIGFIITIKQVIEHTKDYVHEVLAAGLIEYDIESNKILSSVQKNIESGNIEKANTQLSKFNEHETKKIISLCKRMEAEGKFKMKSDVKKGLETCKKFIALKESSSNNSLKSDTVSGL